MKRDLQESVEAWGSVALGVALCILTLQLLRNAEIPTWQPLLTGAVGIISLIVFGRGLWARRHGPKGPNNG